MRYKLFGIGVFLMLLASCRVKKEAGIEVVKLVETTQSWNGDLLPNYPKGKPEITVLKITIPPNTKLDKHYHTVINTGVLLKGELKVVDIDKNILILKEGDVIVELVNKIHYGVNEKNKPAEIIVFYAGEEGLPVTVKTKD
ncbi:cupin domain-containing protein [Seonamhaeicola sp. MEBiC1930]|uniref:cupin domain-containing protein n=1 Tax=Seonamhaeicola sp. MEBiC01930 TaxID=2976768 RepID=UPI0032449B8F